MTKQKEKFKKRSPLIIISVLFLIVLLLGGTTYTFAKYVFSKNYGNVEISADKFYFSTDVTGDTQMVLGQDGKYTFPEKQTKDVILSGDNGHTFSINVRNFYDSSRVTTANITYDISLTGKDANDTTITLPSSVYFTLNSSATQYQLATNQTLVGDSTPTQSQTTINVSIPTYSTWAFENNTVVTLTIHSTAPYSQTIEINLTLQRVESMFTYYIVDSASSPYAELFITTNVAVDAVNDKIKIKWCSGLQIDVTNQLTYTYSGGTFTQYVDLTNRELVVPKAFLQGQSESIVFFKDDATKSYAQTTQTVTKDAQNYYVIELIEVGN